MIISIPNYIKGYRIVSLAKDEETRDMTIKENLPCIFVAENIATFYTECITVSLDEGTANKFASCCNYDVFEIKDDGGAYLYYNNVSEDNAILITNKCNSNCIMCPSPEASRKGGSIGEIEIYLKIYLFMMVPPKHLVLRIDI